MFTGIPKPCLARLSDNGTLQVDLNGQAWSLALKGIGAKVPTSRPSAKPDNGSIARTSRNDGPAAVDPATQAGRPSRAATAEAV